MARLGLIGWRSLVGKVLLERMHQEQDLATTDTYYYSTSQAGQAAPTDAASATLIDAYDIADLAKNDILISTQGSDYTKQVHPKLRAAGWQGYWIDAASYARLHSNSTLVLDPINHHAITTALTQGKKDFIGANCTVSLLLLALAGLIKNQKITQIFTASYQAISGAGSNAIEQLLTDQTLASAPKHLHPLDKIAHIEANLPQNTLAHSVHPWIDSISEAGTTREEHKAYVETEKLLGYAIPIENTCVRVPSLRSHAQAVTIDLAQQQSLATTIAQLESAHDWIKIIPNKQQETLAGLAPASLSNQLNIHIGRIRISKHNPKRIHLFTTADQLLWGAAEPLRRAFKLILNHEMNLDRLMGSNHQASYL